MLSFLSTRACLAAAQGKVSKAVLDSGPPPGDVDAMPEQEAAEPAAEDDIEVQVRLRDATCCPAHGSSNAVQPRGFIHSYAVC